MKREDLVNELVARGYNAELTENVKNGVICKGIVIRQEDSNIAPLFYTGALIAEAEAYNYSIAQATDMLLEMYEKHVVDNFNLKSIFNKSYVLEHIFIGLQKASDEDIIKRNSEFEGIEDYLFLSGKNEQFGDFSIRITKNYLDNLLISEEEAWSKALENTCRYSTMRSVLQILRESWNLPFEFPFDEDTVPLYVLSNATQIKGAGAIYNKELLKEFKELFGVEKAIMFPSSVHEVLIAPYNDDTDIEEYSSIVTEVNGKEVHEIEQLTNRAYIIEL